MLALAPARKRVAPLRSQGVSYEQNRSSIAKKSTYAYSFPNSNAEPQSWANTNARTRSESTIVVVDAA